ncbi:MAG TPA: zinc ribbon domain-containing protein [Candidatus Hydrogenedentes bacterium]|nr:zinc ribbon domain-containing protein [Candidatus Hydrogenedentota bacterium]HOJ67158.1 zinc ribbon domain-containing protein [Candidatus Hydrogenedentota bacterium]HOK89219.1 zinc ribbon domain-containing protein [Candidatus Hydrogenedentota bacterium]HPO30300.1 zinc ribbon domain-containing protein [Candidatus Hydrogenedentota bacterium]
MPTYTYECVKCQATRDVFHAISASPDIRCPECGGKCRRLLGSGAGIIFKGSGFYETDYKRKNGSNGNGHNGSSAAQAKTAAENTKSNTGSGSTTAAPGNSSKS